MGIPFLFPSQINGVGIKATGAGSTLVAGGQNLLWSSTQGRRLIGAGKFVWDGLQNLNAERNGSTDSGVSHRFRALTSGNAEQVQIWFQDGAGYARGNGGTARFRIFPDNGSGVPDMSGVALASVSYSLVNMSGGVFSPRTATQLFPVHTFSSVTPLVAGNLYHVVIDNTAADPIANAFCSDCTMSWSGVTGLAPHRWFNPLDWAALEGTKPAAGSTWTWSDATTGFVAGTTGKAMPLMMIRINGVWQGMMSVSSANPGFADSTNGTSNQWLFGSSKAARQRFTPTANTTVVGTSFVGHCAIAGDLLVELKQGATTLTSTTITSAVNAAAGVSPFSGQTIYKFIWNDVQFPVSVVMNSGTTYDLVFTPQGSSQWRFMDMRNARDYNSAWMDQEMPNYGEYLFAGPSTWYGLNGYNMADNNGQNGTWVLVLHKA
jgi:hypothetical protein